MDELLYSRIKQLKTVDEEVERSLATSRSEADLRRALGLLRYQLADMIRAAEAEHAAF